MANENIPYKIYLNEDEMPRTWYNKHRRSGNPCIFRGSRLFCYYRVISSVFSEGKIQLGSMPKVKPILNGIPAFQNNGIIKKATTSH